MDECRKNYSSNREWRAPREHDPLNQQSMARMGSESEVTSTGPAGGGTRYNAYMLGMLSHYFCGTLNGVSRISLTFFPAFDSLFPLWVALFDFNMRAFALSY